MAALLSNKDSCLFSNKPLKWIYSVRLVSAGDKYKCQVIPVALPISTQTSGGRRGENLCGFCSATLGWSRAEGDMSPKHRSKYKHAAQPTGQWGNKWCSAHPRTPEKVFNQDVGGTWMCWDKQHTDDTGMTFLLQTGQFSLDMLLHMKACHVYFASGTDCSLAVPPHDRCHCNEIICGIYFTCQWF